jgi:hypothetical protein
MGTVTILMVVSSVGGSPFFPRGLQLEAAFDDLMVRVLDLTGNPKVRYAQLACCFLIGGLDKRWFHKSTLPLL